MVYRRRYFPALTITTISYAEKSITAEKLADGAVIHPKVAPDAIDSERVIDESLKSVDIKDGEIKTPDIQDGAVTTPKIASAAVTPEKLSVSVLTRPISPGVNTAEVLDANITLNKLAPNSVNASKIVAGGVDVAALAGNVVETAKIKDANVTLAKMAPDSIDNTVIKANTIRGTEIATGACGESELGTDSVVTVKVKGRNITSPKIALNGIIPELIAPNAVTSVKLDTAALAKSHLSSKMARIKGIHEEFIGGVLPDEWVAAIAAGGLVSPDGIRGLSILTGALNGDDVVITSDYLGYIAETLPFFDAQILFQQLTLRDLFVGVEDGGTNRVGFASGTGPGSTNLWAQCDYADGAVYVDTGIIADTFTQHILAFEVVSAASVKFYVDGILKATIPSTIPATTPVFPKIEFIAREVGGKELNVRYLSLLMDKP